MVVREDLPTLICRSAWHRKASRGTETQSIGFRDILWDSNAWRITYWSGRFIFHAFIHVWIFFEYFWLSRKVSHFMTPHNKARRKKEGTDAFALSFLKFLAGRFFLPLFYRRLQRFWSFMLFRYASIFYFFCKMIIIYTVFMSNSTLFKSNWTVFLVNLALWKSNWTSSESKWTP